MQINVVSDFSDTPGARFRKDGLWSGQQFREELLKPLFLQALQRGEKLTVNLDGVYGYATSFLEEAFGGLAREIEINTVLDNIEFISEEEPGLLDEIREYVQQSRG